MLLVVVESKKILFLNHIYRVRLELRPSVLVALVNDFVASPLIWSIRTLRTSRYGWMSSSTRFWSCQEKAVRILTSKKNLVRIWRFKMCFKKGVGKSTVTCSLALSLASKNFSVGIVDLDLCGPSINNMMKIKDENIVQTAWGWKPCE